MNESSDIRSPLPFGKNVEALRRQLADVPSLPGVYLWKNAQGTVLYVGKAKRLRERMRQYVNLQDERAKIPLLLSQIDSFEYIVVENEHEALVLENNLIKQHSPYFNADFKDSKSYPFIALTKGEVFPAIKYTREKHNPKTRYFGPYTDSRAARELVDTVRKVVPICSAQCAEYKQLCRRLEAAGGDYRSLEPGKPCFDAHVGIGPGACCGRISPQEYRRQVAAVERFLAGNRAEFVDRLTEQMRQAAEDLDFERAARLKSRIQTIGSLNSRQHAVSTRNLDADVVGISREETIAAAHVFQIREGRIINSNEFILDKGRDIPDEDLLHTFLLRYYDQTTSIPHEVILERELEDSEALERWLTDKLASSHGAKVRLTVPQKGEKAQLLAMAQTNAGHTLNRYKVRTSYEDKRTNQALLQLESALALDAPPMRIECFDVSTIHGSYTVASMVVFTAGKPDPSQYRKFKIRTPLNEANDFLSMQEVLGRRFSPQRMADERFGKKPDLLVLDGGKPQLTAALTKLEELGITDIACCGLAKRDEEIFVPWQDSGPVVLPSGSASLYLIKHVRDESHRTAIGYHRQLRARGMTKSVLDDVAGMGPKRKKLLLEKIGGWRKLKSATLEEIVACKAVPLQVAQEVYRVLQDASTGEKEATWETGESQEGENQ